jgi:hypothetical protein
MTTTTTTTTATACPRVPAPPLFFVWSLPFAPVPAHAPANVAVVARPPAKRDKTRRGPDMPDSPPEAVPQLSTPAPSSVPPM